MRLTIGEIVKAQGIKGEVKVKPYTDDPVRFATYKTLVIGGCPFNVKECAVRAGFIYLMLDGVSTRNDAETLVGRKIEIDRSMAVQPAGDEYFIVDLIGCKVYLTSGEFIGTLKAVDNFGSADVFTVKGEKTVRFPFLKRLNLQYNSSEKTITLDADRFSEVCCYED